MTKLYSSLFRSDSLSSTLYTLSKFTSSIEQTNSPFSYSISCKVTAIFPNSCTNS